jgi:hypothetical protein
MIILDLPKEISLTPSKVSPSLTPSIALIVKVVE